jgi:hypothetical protein
MLARPLNVPFFMAEQERERRRHWTGHEKVRLRRYQDEWEVRSKAPEDQPEDRSYDPGRRLDPPGRTDEK